MKKTIKDIDVLIKEADKLMYQAKDEYYKKSGINRRTI